MVLARMFMVTSAYIIGKGNLPFRINIFDKALLPSAFRTGQLRASLVFWSVNLYSVIVPPFYKCSSCSLQLLQFCRLPMSSELQTANTARCKPCSSLQFLIFSSFDFPDNLARCKVDQHIHHRPFGQADFFSCLDGFGGRKQGWYVVKQFFLLRFYALHQHESLYV